MKTALLLMPDDAIAQNVARSLADYRIIRAVRASEAIAVHEHFDIAIIELSLAGHSGFEFLYEMRSYADWRDTPVIIYSRIHVDSEVLQSRSFRSLGAHYAYQPETSLAELKLLVEKSLPA